MNYKSNSNSNNNQKENIQEIIPNKTTTIIQEIEIWTFLKIINKSETSKNLIKCKKKFTIVYIMKKNQTIVKK